MIKLDDTIPRAVRNPGSHSGVPPSGGKPGIYSRRLVVIDSGFAAFDLGFTRDRHYQMRTSATADVRWRPRMTCI